MATNMKLIAGITISFVRIGGVVAPGADAKEVHDVKLFMCKYFGSYSYTFAMCNRLKLKFGWTQGAPSPFIRSSSKEEEYYLDLTHIISSTFVGKHFPSQGKWQMVILCQSPGGVRVCSGSQRNPP